MSFAFLILSAFLFFLAFARTGVLAQCGISARLFFSFVFLISVSRYLDPFVFGGMLVLHPVRILCALLCVWFFLSSPMPGWTRYRAVLGAVLFSVPLYFLRRQYPEGIGILLSTAPCLLSGMAAVLSFAICPSPSASMGCCALSCTLTEAAFALADRGVFDGTAELGADPFCTVLFSGLLLTALLYEILHFLCGTAGERLTS